MTINEIIQEKKSKVFSLFKTVKRLTEQSIRKTEPQQHAKLISVGMGVIYFIAFASLLTQVMGLYGESGIRPIKNTLDFIVAKNISIWSYPTLFFVNTSDVFILLLCWVGIVASILLCCGVLPLLSSFIFQYLSSFL